MCTDKFLHARVRSLRNFVHNDGFDTSFNEATDQNDPMLC